MSPKKTIFIIPGYRQKPTSKAYQAIAMLFNAHGYELIMVSLSWKNTTVAQNTEHFLQQYKKVRRKKKYILGFSFGAMVAFLAATKVNVSGVILCSLSPFFKEDNKGFLDLQFRQLVKQVKAEQIVLLYGTKEVRSLIKRVKETFLSLSSKQKVLFPIKNTDHSIGDKRYLQSIHQVTKLLN